MTSPSEDARRLYDACPTPKPAWTQLGPVTQSVWLEYAVRKAAGIKDWWSRVNPDTGKLQSRASGVLRHLPYGVNMESNNEQIAKTLDEMATLCLNLAGHFRPAASNGKGAGGNGKAARKPAAEPPAEAEGDGVTEDDVREKLKELAGAKGKEAMLEAMASVGATKLAEVDESQYQDLIDKADELLEAEDEDSEPAKPAAKTTRARKPKGSTLAEVNAAASALIAADKPAYLKLMKKLGKPSDMDAGDYASAIEAYTAAMPEDDDALL